MERYQKDINQIHAPLDLIESTKQKCREAEAQQKKEAQKKKKRIAYLVPAVAAAVVCIAVIPFIGQGTKQTGQPQEDMQMHLGQQDKLNETKENLIIKTTAVIPMLFLEEEATIEEIAGAKVYIVQGKKDYYSACVTGEEEYTVIESKITEKEEFLTLLTELLQ